MEIIILGLALPMRLTHGWFMEKNASAIIDALGGTTAVHRLTETPISTIHSWRKKGIPAGRLAHLKLVAANEGITLPIDAKT